MEIKELILDNKRKMKIIKLIIIMRLYSVIRQEDNDEIILITEHMLNSSSKNNINNN